MTAERVAIQLANSTEVTAENFIKNIFEHYKALRDAKISNELTFNSENIKSDTTTSPPTIVASTVPPLLRLKNILTSTVKPSPSKSEHKNFRDDEDMENDYEASGTRNWNDTTILLDEESRNSA